MKLAVFADIHSNYPVFKKAYDDALKRKVDNFLFLGDYITDGFDTNKIIDIVKTSKGFAINGNREVSIINYFDNKNEIWDKHIQYKSMKYAYDTLNKCNMKYLKSLPIYKVVNINKKKICISHGTPYSATGKIFKDSYDIFDRLINDFDCDIYLFGHRHEYYNTLYKNKYFINAGSIGFPADGLPFKYGILTIDDEIKYDKIEIEYDYFELEKYYKNSKYYSKATIWCSLLLEFLKTGENHTQLFIDYTVSKALENNIDISDAIPNELFINSYDEYMKKIK